MSALDRVRTLYADYNALDSALSLLGWDKQVLMPAGGTAARTAHIERLTRMRHTILTGDEMRQAVSGAASDVDPESEDGAMIAALQRDLDVETKLPLELVERKARVSNEAYEVWKRAKAENDFPAMEPYYRELFGIARETAEALGYEGSVYDPLLGLYEYGSKEADARAMFDALKPRIVALVREINGRGRSNDDAPLRSSWEPETLRTFAEHAAGVVGFDFGRGRLNVCGNAFCTHLAASDVRMTTRPSDHVKGVISSSLHEMGHGLYEQNSPAKWERTPLAGGISLAVHESQSRLWENIVGRSRGFWTRFLPDLQALLPTLASLDVESFYRMINRVEPTFVRVGADELTYNLHILVRFELEVDLVSGRLDVADLPEAWNAKYTEYLGITPPTNTLGVLQDVHWSRGYVGYFPTYAMGNLIGGQMWKCLQRDLGDTDAMMARGNFGPILDWLRERVYRQGRRYTPRELVTRITGRPMEAADWLEYADAKYRDIYSL